MTVIKSANLKCCEVIGETKHAKHKQVQALGLVR